MKILKRKIVKSNLETYFVIFQPIAVNINVKEMMFCVKLRKLDETANFKKKTFH